MAGEYLQKERMFVVAPIASIFVLAPGFITCDLCSPVQPVEMAIRQLNEMGVFCVFIILDSLSKVWNNINTRLSIFYKSCAFLLQDSIVDIKVPTFSAGKVSCNKHCPQHCSYAAHSK